MTSELDCVLKRRPACSRSRRKLDEVVDFPVGNQNQFAVAGEQRLIPAAQVDNRQPRVGHAERPVDVTVGMVRAAVGKRSYRRLKPGRVD